MPSKKLLQAITAMAGFYGIQRVLYNMPFSNLFLHSLFVLHVTELPPAISSLLLLQGCFLYRQKGKLNASKLDLTKIRHFHSFACESDHKADFSVIWVMLSIQTGSILGRQRGSSIKIVPLRAGGTQGETGYTGGG